SVVAVKVVLAPHAHAYACARDRDVFHLRVLETSVHPKRRPHLLGGILSRQRCRRVRWLRRWWRDGWRGIRADGRSQIDLRWWRRCWRRYGRRKWRKVFLRFLRPCDARSDHAENHERYRQVHSH